MIGWFNASLAHYFRERYGEAFVHEVLQRAGLDMAAGGPSDDQATYSVVEIAAGLLGKESELLWEVLPCTQAPVSHRNCQMADACVVSIHRSTENII